MKNKRIYSSFLSDKKEAICKDENNVSSTSSPILKYDTNDSKNYI